MSDRMTEHICISWDPFGAINRMDRQVNIGMISEMMMDDDWETYLLILRLSKESLNNQKNKEQIPKGNVVVSQIRSISQISNSVLIFKDITMKLS